MTASEEPTSLGPRPGKSSYPGRGVLAILVAAIVVLATALFLSLSRPESQPTKPEWPTVPSAESVIINDTALVLSTSTILWISLNDTPREGDWWWGWGILQVVVTLHGNNSNWSNLYRNDSSVSWGTHSAGLSLGVPNVVDFGMGEARQGSKENLSFSLAVADIKGNGYFDFGDYFFVTSHNSSLLVPGKTYTISLIHSSAVLWFPHNFEITITEEGFTVRDVTPYGLHPM